MRKPKDMSPDVRIPISEKLAYSVGGQGAAMYNGIVSAFLLVYYTNVVGIGAGSVATIMGISKVLDGLSDLAAGYLIDRTHTKWGKCRPWLLRMILPMVICMFLLLNVPTGFPDMAKLVYIFVTYNLVSTVCATMMGVAHSALNGCMTINQKDRGINGGFIMLFGIVTGLVQNSTVLQICSAAGGGDPYTQRGWNAMLVIYSVVFILLTLYGFFFTRERVTLATWNQQKEAREHTTDKSKKYEEVKVLEALKILIHDKYWVIFVVTMICVLYMQTSNGMANIYFAQYVLDDVFLYTPLANCTNIGALAGAVATLVLMTKFKKKNICITGIALVSIGSVLPAISQTMAVLYAASILKGVGAGIAGCVLPGMLQDSITYAQWKSGRDVLGMGNAAYSFTNKLGGSGGTIIFGWILEFSGFNGMLDVQPAGAVTAINALYIWIPFLTMVLAFVCMWFYDLDNKYDKIAADMKERMGFTEDNK